MPDKPWLGAQEAQYASLLWHLDVPISYTSQINATRSVFPGKAMVNVERTTANRAVYDAHAQVNIKGFSQAWVTDMECATSFRPKMYGFDFGRVTEAYELDGKKRLIVEKTQEERAMHTGLPGERAMMKDLMLSAMREGGEICMTHHTFNPFLPKIDRELNGNDIGSLLSLRPANSLGASAAHEMTINHLGLVDITTGTGAVAKARAIVDNNAKLLGAFLKEIIEDEASGGKDIWIRLLHEPNVNYFWWGHPHRQNTGDFYVNYMRLWHRIVDKIKEEVHENQPTGSPKLARLKFVFCINGEEITANLDPIMDLYFPASRPAEPNDIINKYLKSIDVLGLDYYEDWTKVASESGFYAQYRKVRDRAVAMSAAPDLSWEHALTEVSIRTESKGKLYGAYGGDGPWPTEAGPADNRVQNRRFFEKNVLKVVEDFQPKWVLFWVNRIGNAILSSHEPTTDQEMDGETPLYYHLKTNVFTSDYVQHFFPIFPAEPFVFESFKAGDDSGGKTFFPVSQTEQIPKLPGASLSDANDIHVQPYKDAILDFFQIVPQTRRTANTAMARAVEQFLCDPTLPRPVIDPAPTAAQKAELLFEVL